MSLVIQSVGVKLEHRFKYYRTYATVTGDRIHKTKKGCYLWLQRVAMPLQAEQMPKSSMD
ncbi:hypothetical protein [Allocoleopsis franciscana]|uniref:hypothetical protein n=1 Tax=Allocoleopsis franciscana TaxID=2886352 RepID=UPI000319DEDD|nr:hypothetical protein [Allocoleopsis franciscana]